MNDRAISVLDNYELEVIKTRKGRGAILCETKQGLYILKEYLGPREKVHVQKALLEKIEKQGYVPAEMILENKEGQLLTTDQDETIYLVKTYFEGRECNVRDLEECKEAVRTLAGLHRVMCLGSTDQLNSMQVFSLEKEYEKHNKELKKVRKFLKEKSQKTEFELYLLNHYDYFLEQALSIAEEWKTYTFIEDSEYIRQKGILCHGDYQYHNIIMTGADMAVINFEKCILDHPVRDLYLFMRKILEKSNWSIEVGSTLLQAYDSVQTLSAQEKISLYYRFAYPEKFWKIVNFYYNSGKAWIPGRNMEKLQKLLTQEEDKQKFLDTLFRRV